MFGIFKRKTDDYDIEKIKKLNFPKKIKKLAELAKKSDPNYKNFASERCKYSFNECISMEKIREFEKNHRIKMPEQLVRYLTEIGNGGAGVDYGIYPLEKMEAVTSDSDKSLFDYDDYEERWKTLTEKIEEEVDSDDFDEEKCGKMMDFLTDGLIYIGTAGCTVDYCIICKGREYGKIAFIDMDYIPECPPQIIADSLEEWLAKHFMKIISKTDDK